MVPQTNKDFLSYPILFGNNTGDTREISLSMDVFRIPAGVLAKALDACRGRRYLAGSLTQLISSKEEWKESNRSSWKKSFLFSKVVGYKGSVYRRIPDLPI